MKKANKEAVKKMAEKVIKKTAGKITKKRAKKTAPKVRIEDGEEVPAIPLIEYFRKVFFVSNRGKVGECVISWPALEEARKDQSKCFPGIRKDGYIESLTPADVFENRPTKKEVAARIIQYHRSNRDFWKREVRRMENKKKEIEKSISKCSKMAETEEKQIKRFEEIKKQK